MCRFDPLLDRDIALDDWKEMDRMIEMGTSCDIGPLMAFIASRHFVGASSGADREPSTHTPAAGAGVRERKTGDGSRKRRAPPKQQAYAGLVM